MSLTVDSGQTLQRCLALDIGGTKIASAIVKNGEIEQRKQISTPQDDAAQVMHQTLAQLLKEYEGQFDYVAVASTGIINQGILTALNPKNLGGLAQFPLKDSIAQHTDKPIGLLNDVQAAAYAEYQLQNPDDVQNFTFITVSMSSLFIQFVPVITLTNDPIMNALFGGVVMGTGIGFALRNNISSGGTDIVSLTIRKRTGKNVGSISFLVNGTIMLIAGLTFGWKYALYSMITIFVSSRVTDAVFTKQKRMQAMIVTSQPDAIIEKIHKKLHRGATIIHNAEGTYNHQEKAVLLTVITRAEFNEFKYIMKKADPQAFITISENVYIIGRFVETEE